MAPSTKKMKLMDSDVSESASDSAMHKVLRLPELRAAIFGYLSSSEKGLAAAVCHDWRDTSEQPSLWSNATCKLHRDSPIPTDILKRRRVRKFEMINMDSESLHSTLRELVRNHPNVKGLKFSSGCELSNNILQDVLPPSGLPSMTTLELIACVKVTDVGIDVIARMMPNLELLNLESCRQLTDTSMLHIAKELHQLKHLNLRSCPLVTANGIGFLVSQSHPQGMCNSNAAHLVGKKSTILTLNLRGCQGVTDDALQHLTNLVGLHTLNQSFCKSFTDDGMANLAKMANLKKLELAFCDGVTDVGLAHLAETSSSLRVLNLYCCQNISTVGIGSLATGKLMITSLDITNCSGIGSDGLQLIASGMIQLARLRLDRHHLTSGGLRMAQRSLSNLSHMYINGPNNKCWLNSVA